MEELLEPDGSTRRIRSAPLQWVLRPAIRIDGKVTETEHEPMLTPETDQEVDLLGAFSGPGRSVREGAGDRLFFRGLQPGALSHQRLLCSAAPIAAVLRVIPFETYPLRSAGTAGRTCANGYAGLQKGLVLVHGSRQGRASPRRWPRWSTTSIKNRHGSHRHGRGSDRIPPPQQEVAWSPSARSVGIRTGLPEPALRSVLQPGSRTSC